MGSADSAFGGGVGVFMPERGKRRALLPVAFWRGQTPRAGAIGRDVAVSSLQIFCVLGPAGRSTGPS
jgi:hypothetical protein